MTIPFTDRVRVTIAETDEIDWILAAPIIFGIGPVPEQADWVAFYGAQWSGNLENQFDGYFITPHNIADDPFNAGRSIQTAITPSLAPAVANGTLVFDSDDFWSGAEVDDRAFLGAGADVFIGGGGADVLVGGDGTDYLRGDDDNDLLYGDYTNVPVYDVVTPPTQPNSSDFFFISAIQPAEDKSYLLNLGAEDPTVTGDDTLLGGPGLDLLFGGPGDDQLFAGPWEGAELMVGGPGGDLFYLSADAEEAADDGWWSQYRGDIIGGGARGAIQSVVSGLTDIAINTFFKSTGVGLLVKTIGGLFGVGGGTAAASGIKGAFGSADNANGTADESNTVVIGDFDPREDVIYLPLPENSSISASVEIVSSNKFVGQLGAVDTVAVFLKSDSTIFAEVRIAQDFFDDFVTPRGTTIASDSFQAVTLVENFFQAKLQVRPDGVVDNPGALPTTYADILADDANFDGSISSSDFNLSEFDAWTAPAGQTVNIYGAFSPLAVSGSFVDSTAGALISGTYVGDILSAEGAFLAPNELLAGGSAQAGSTIHGWTGGDVIFGALGIDNLYGDDGDDTLYAVGSNGVNTREYAFGGTGNDTIYAGFKKNYLLIDGGDGIDTVDYSLLTDGTVSIDLSVDATDHWLDSVPTGTPLSGVSDHQFNGTSDIEGGKYAIQNVENAIGVTQCRHADR